MRRIPVIIDCDTGIDDILSFVLAFASDNLDIRGITTVAGNQQLKMTTFNTLNGMNLMGRNDIPLAMGEAGPLERELKDAGYIHGENGLGTYSFRSLTEKKADERHATEFMRDIIMDSKEKITILALAPLTNVALLMKKYPDCRDRIDRIVFMGGSIRTGNPTPVSTFNVLVDPEASREVMMSGVPFHMCPLDTTRHAYTTEEEIEDIGKINNPVAEMAYEVCKFYNKTVNESNNAKARFKGLCIHDLCTVAYVTNPEFFTTVKYYGDVETKGELTTGFTMIDYEDILQKTDDEKNITFIDSVDRDGVMRVFFEALNKYVTI